MRITKLVTYVLFAFFCAFMGPRDLHAQCPPGLVLVGEDEKYWYCEHLVSDGETVAAYEKLQLGLLDDNWRYRKALIEAVASLLKDGTKAVNGGKLRVTAGGRVAYECVASECAGQIGVVDCSGAVAYGGLSACFVGGIYRAAFPELKNALDRDAGGQAEYFSKYQAFMSKSARPTPGDLVFFKDTSRKKKGITHVAVFIGTNQLGDMMILQASTTDTSPRVEFVWLKREDSLAKKIAGYGDTGRLYLSILKHPR